jgi:hypothetical protein
MKLNFWQWLAVVLLIIGAALWIYERNHGTTATTPAHPTTQGAVAR